MMSVACSPCASSIKTPVFTIFDAVRKGYQSSDEGNGHCVPVPDCYSMVRVTTYVLKPSEVALVRSDIGD